MLSSVCKAKSAENEHTLEFWNLHCSFFFSLFLFSQFRNIQTLLTLCTFIHTMYEDCLWGIWKAIKCQLNCNLWAFILVLVDFSFHRKPSQSIVGNIEIFISFKGFCNNQTTTVPHLWAWACQHQHVSDSNSDMLHFISVVTIPEY